MSGFQTMMRTDAAKVFCNANDFGETVVYKKVDGTTRSISVVVDRHPPERIDANGMAYTPKMEVHCANDSVLGISTDEEKADGTGIMILAEIIGGETREWHIWKPVTSEFGKAWQDQGMIKLEIK